MRKREKEISCFAEVYAQNDTLRQYPCAHKYTPYCLILQPNLPQCLICCLTCFGWSWSPQGLGCGFSNIVFSVLYCTHQPGRGVGGQAKRAIGK